MFLTYRCVYFLFTIYLFSYQLFSNNKKSSWQSAVACLFVWHGKQKRQKQTVKQLIATAVQTTRPIKTLPSIYIKWRSNWQDDKKGKNITSWRVICIIIDFISRPYLQIMYGRMSSVHIDCLVGNFIPQTDQRKPWRRYHSYLLELAVLWEVSYYTMEW